MSSARALAKLKKDVFLPQCWTPALTAQPKPAVAKFQLDVTFNPQGQSVTVGVGEDRSAERYDVAQCLRGTVIVLNIPPPGATVRTILPLEFP